SLDAELGRLLEHPRLAHAALAVTADHGESLGEHETFFDHVLLYPDTLHVPLVLRADGLPRGVRVRAPVRQIDIGRALLDLSGLAAGESGGESVLGAREREPAQALDATRAEPRFALAAQGNAASLQRGAHYAILHLTAHQEHASLRSFARHQLEL